MQRIRLANTRHGKTVKIELGGTDSYFTVNRLPDGRAIEVFLVTDRKSEVQGWATCFCIAVNMALQNGVPARRLIAKLKGQRFDPQGGPGEAVSVADALAKWWCEDEKAAGQ